jgi:hypothetical protein
MAYGQRQVKIEARIDVGFPAILAGQVLLNLMEEADIARRLVIAEARRKSRFRHALARRRGRGRGSVRPF